MPRLNPGTGTNNRPKMVVKRSMSYCPTSDMNCLCTCKREAVSLSQLGGRLGGRLGGGGGVHPG